MAEEFKPESNLILITGDEEYLRDAEKKRLIKALGGTESLNFHAFNIDNLDLNEIRRLIETVPFMEPYRRILISGTGLLGKSPGSGSSDATDPVEVLSGIPASTVVILDEAEADQRGRLYKHIRQNGRILRFDKAESLKGNARYEAEDRVKAFAEETLRSAGRRIDRRNLDYLIGLTGYDMRNLSTELEKLISYLIGRPDGYTVTAGDIDMIITRTLKDRIFLMMDEKLKGHTAEALYMLEELFALKTPPMRIIYLLASRLDQAVVVRDSLDRGLSDARIEELTGLKSWQIKRYRSSLRGLTTGELKVMLNAAADAEELIKTGRMDARLSAELLIIG